MKDRLILRLVGLGIFCWLWWRYTRPTDFGDTAALSLSSMMQARYGTDEGLQRMYEHWHWGPDPEGRQRELGLIP